MQSAWFRRRAVQVALPVQTGCAAEFTWQTRSAATFFQLWTLICLRQEAEGPSQATKITCCGLGTRLNLPGISLSGHGTSEIGWTLATAQTRSCGTSCSSPRVSCAWRKSAKRNSGRILSAKCCLTLVVECPPVASRRCPRIFSPQCFLRFDGYLSAFTSLGVITLDARTRWQPWCWRRGHPAARPAILSPGVLKEGD